MAFTTLGPCSGMLASPYLRNMLQKILKKENLLRETLKKKRCAHNALRQ
jgi:hypothetical protein